MGPKRTISTQLGAGRYNQHAFIWGKQILDAALIANEAVDSRLKANILASF